MSHCFHGLQGRPCQAGGMDVACCSTPCDCHCHPASRPAWVTPPTTAANHPAPPNRMCYLFCRCTRSISVVPAAQYAHLAAFRGRVLCRGGEIVAAELHGRMGLHVHMLLC